MSRFRRGDVIWQNITGKMRPYIVVSNNIGNFHSERVNVIPLTTSEKKMHNRQPTHCLISYGNVRPSIATAEEMHTITPAYDTEIMEHLPRYIMHDVSECMRIQYDIENNI